LTLSLLSFLLFFGCNQDSEVTSPTTLSMEKQWITLSDNSGLSVEETFTKTKKKASGDRGWNITFDHFFSSGIRIMGDLDCHKNAYDGRLTFSFTLSDNEAVIDFNPSPFTFEIPVEYTIIYEGLDLTGVNPEDVDFYYVAPGGGLVKAEYTRLEVDIAAGRLFVLDAKLPHFSRYGFVN
ncbi:MAG: hypothetical protein KJO12_01495, partial [Ignavibacteria bacterium]|nr:hypothetical protein [Ignavibacteria bacterium]